LIEPYAPSLDAMFAEQTQIGECFEGDGVDAAHINTVLGRYGSGVEVAWATALATPRPGHAAFMTVLQPNLPVQPLTLFVNKATIASDRHGELTWGAAQAGVAAGVCDAVAAGIVPVPEAADLLLIAAVWVNPGASNADAVFANNRRATAAAITNGANRRPAVADALAHRNEPFNPYYAPRPS
jgi:5,6,7,8-tetrahydromethanopterin hydro-lyase